MSTAQLQLDIVSPERRLYQEPVSMAVIPAELGMMGVLPGHAPMVVALAPGVLDLYSANVNEISERFFIGGGVAEVTATSCTVLAEHAVPFGELNRAALETELANLTKAIATSINNEETQTLTATKALVEAKLVALG